MGHRNRDVEEPVTQANDTDTLLSHSPLTMGELAGWLETLRFAQFDRIWTASLADVITREPPSLPDLLFLCRYVRYRYARELARAVGMHRVFRAPVDATQVLWADGERARHERDRWVKVHGGTPRATNAQVEKGTGPAPARWKEP